MGTYPASSNVHTGTSPLGATVFSMENSQFRDIPRKLTAVLGYDSPPMCDGCSATTFILLEHALSYAAQSANYFAIEIFNCFCVQHSHGQARANDIILQVIKQNFAR